MKTLGLPLCCLLVALASAGVRAQSDLDAFMREVLAHRDDNWKKLQQYVLDERQSWDVRGPGRAPLWGDRREFTWFIQDGVFVRSPLRVNGITISERERRDYEARFLKDAKARERRGGAADMPAAPPVDTPAGLSSLLSQRERPQFISAAYFLRFRFDEGHYALAGRERLEERDVLRIEYYPTNLFRPDTRRRERDDSRRRREPANEPEPAADAQMLRLMNKTSKVTLWIDPASHQILKYTFDDLGWDFLPGQWLLRMNDVTATMTVGQMFPDVWLPRRVDMRAQMGTAAGAVDVEFAIDYEHYRRADVTATIGIPGAP